MAEAASKSLWNRASGLYHLLCDRPYGDKFQFGGRLAGMCFFASCEVLNVDGESVLVRPRAEPKCKELVLHTRMTVAPIYLFADSQLLFWRLDGECFLRSLRRQIQEGVPKAAYLGASNGCKPEFYSIFQAAMENIDVVDCRMIGGSLSSADESFMEQASVVLLAGGEVKIGWNSFKAAGLDELIVRRYSEGAVLVGVSAGAVQLGMLGWEEREVAEDFFVSFGLVPFVISAHDEERDWSNLKRATRFIGEGSVGIGLPKGAGMIYHPDQQIEAIRRPVSEYRVRGEDLVCRVLLPG